MSKTKITSLYKLCDQLPVDGSLNSRRINGGTWSRSCIVYRYKLALA